MAHLYNADVLSMPDKWEYPWYAAWDLAFHCVPLALVDPDFAKEQLTLLLREWYMHPNGQLPAYEWAFGDVNPPVHAWAALRVYKIERAHDGRGRPRVPRAGLPQADAQLHLVGEPQGRRRAATSSRAASSASTTSASSTAVAPLPAGGHLEQADGTSWMGMYCLNMLAIALELARDNPAYEDVASKFFEHFLYIAHAMNNRGSEGIALWDEEDGFYYDVLHLPDGDALSAARPIDGRAHPALRGRDARAGHARRAARLPTRASSGSSRTGPTSMSNVASMRRRRARRSGACSRS